MQRAQGAASKPQEACHISAGPLLQQYQGEELTYPISFSHPLTGTPPLPQNLPLSVSVYLPLLLVGCGAARPAGVLEGGAGAKAGEGEGRGAAQGWHGNPRPHPQLCGKVSGGVCWGVNGSDSWPCLFCNRGEEPLSACVFVCFCVSVYMCVFRNGEGDYVHMSYLLLLFCLSCVFVC